MYTVLGEDKLYYCDATGREGAMEYGVFLKMLQLFRKTGYSSNYAFMPMTTMLTEKKEVLLYLKDGDVMTAFWNIILYIEGTKTQEQ